MGEQAQEQAGQGELQAAEELWLRADCPAAALLMYRTAQRWKHAARIACQFFPDQVLGGHCSCQMQGKQQGVCVL